jgi:hypothetical protein
MVSGASSATTPCRRPALRCRPVRARVPTLLRPARTRKILRIRIHAEEGQVQCETPTVNLSLYHSQPERQSRPQTLERLTKDWTRDRSAGLRHGVRSSEHSQRHRSAGLRHGDVFDPTQSPAGVRTEIDRPESGGGPPQSTTWRKHDGPRPSRSVVEAPSPRLRRPEVRALPRRLGCGPRGRREMGIRGGGRTRIARLSRPGERQTPNRERRSLNS